MPVKITGNGLAAACQLFYRNIYGSVEEAIRREGAERQDDSGSNEENTCSKIAYQLVNGLISGKQGRSTSIQHMSGKCLTEEQMILSRWTEHYSKLYNHDRYDTL